MGVKPWYIIACKVTPLSDGGGRARRQGVAEPSRCRWWVDARRFEVGEGQPGAARWRCAMFSSLDAKKGRGQKKGTSG